MNVLMRIRYWWRLRYIKRAARRMLKDMTNADPTLTIFYEVRK